MGFIFLAHFLLYLLLLKTKIIKINNKNNIGWIANRLIGGLSSRPIAYGI
jgi:hypothetical protein